MFSELILEDVELKKGYNSKSLVLLSFEEYICIFPLFPVLRDLLSFDLSQQLPYLQAYISPFVSCDPCKKILGSL